MENTIPHPTEKINENLARMRDEFLRISIWKKFVHPCGSEILYNFYYIPAYTKYKL